MILHDGHPDNSEKRTEEVEEVSDSDCRLLDRTLEAKKRQPPRCLRREEDRQTDVG